MSEFENQIKEIIRSHLTIDQRSSFDDDIMQYIINIIDEMSLDERKSSIYLYSSISPFVIDCCSDSDDVELIAENICKAIAKSFGGSGYSKVLNTSIEDNENLILLSAPIKISEKTGLNKAKTATYGGSVISNYNNHNVNNDLIPAIEVSYNANLDAGVIPTTQKQARKQRRDNEKLQKILRMEEMARLSAEREMSLARMAAIKANRNNRRQAAMGVNIERFSIPHPSGTADLLTDASLVLSSHRRYGLIGKNGAGKSTLMRLLANYKINGLLHLRILLVDQHVEGDRDSALQWVLRADVERTALLEDEQRLIACQHGNLETSNLPKDLQGVDLEVALTECYERMDAIGVPTSEFRARKILTGLGFTNEMMDKSTEGLSGGWAMRAALAAALFVTPDLLLLDEPTNHLDLHALVWLEQWLTSSFPGILLVVSHDQVFLDAVCTDILELKSTLAGQSKASLIHYSGDYGTYLNTIEEQKIAQARLRVAYEKERDKLREFIARDGKKYDNPAHQSQRKMKMKQLENLVEVEGLEENSELIMKFPRPYGTFSRDENLISVTNASFRWSESDPVLFENVEICIGANARIAILGKNGCGKTSLLNILDGESTPSSGTVKRHLGCRIARLQQHHYKGEQLDPNLNALEHMRRLPQEETSSVGLHDPETRQEETAQRSYLSNFGIAGNKAMLPIRYLSGGQRMRVALACALYRRPDLLILDEPTNHLDADTVRALCEALATYEGAIIAVSHDESFVNKVINHTLGGDKASKCDGTALPGELWVMSKAKLMRFDGTFKEYKKLISKKLHTFS